MRFFWTHPDQGLGEPIPNPPPVVTMDMLHVEPPRMPFKRPFFQPLENGWYSVTPAPAPSATIDKWLSEPSTLSLKRLGIELMRTQSAFPPVLPTRELRQTGYSLSLQAGTHVMFSSLTAGSTAPAPYLFYIDGLLRTDKVSIALESASIQMQLGATPSASFTVLSLDGTYRPAIDDEVIIIDSSTGARVFGGDIDNTEEQNPDNTNIITTRVRATGYSSRLDRRIVSGYFDGVTILYTPQTMISDLLNIYLPETGIVLGGGADGAVIDTETIFQHVSGTQAVRQLLDKDGLDFVVDAFKRLYVVSRTAGYAAAPFNLADGDGNWDSDSMSVRRERGKYANRVGLRADLREPGMWVDTFAGNDDFGVGFYLTSYIQNSAPVVTVNGVVQTVGEYWLAQGSNTFTYVPGGYGVYASTPGAYLSSDTIEVSYPSPLQPITWAEDAAEIALNGIAETVVDVKDVYDPDRWDDIAAGELARLKRRSYVVEYVTQQQGLRPGQLQAINTTKPLVPNLSLIIDNMTGTFQPTSSGGFFRWRVSATNSQVQGEKNFVRTFQRLGLLKIQPQDRHRLTIVAKLAEDIPGLTNPGLIVVTVPGDREVDKPGFLKEIRLRFGTAPATRTVQIDVRKNGTTIFPNSQYIEFRVADAGLTVTKRNFTAQPLQIADGDKFTAHVITADSAAKNGTLEIEVQG